MGSEKIGKSKLLLIFLLAILLLTPVIEQLWSGPNKVYFSSKINTSVTGFAQVFYDSGSGYNEVHSKSIPLKSNQSVDYIFEIPGEGVKSIRFDPINKGGSFAVGDLRLETSDGKVIKTFQASDFITLDQYKSGGSLNPGYIFNSGADPNIVLKNSDINYKPSVLKFIKKNYLKITFELIKTYLILLISVLLFNRLVKKYKDKNYEYFLTGLVYIYFVIHLPVSLYINAPHDDAMFWNRAFSILNGEWLGPYTNMVLPKGATFSIFLAFNSLTGLPITLTMGLLYWFSVYNLSKILVGIGFNRHLIFVLYLLVLFHPAMQPIRIIRDNIYPALVILAMCGFIELFVNRSNSKRQLLKFCLYGVALGFMLSTREEGLWIAPAVLMLLAGYFYVSIRNRNSFLECAKPLLAIALGAIVVVTAISFLNYKFYGKFQPTDMGGQFSKAVTNLSAIRIGDGIPYVPLSNFDRNEIYKISPQFNELKEYFEGPGKGWTKLGCDMYPESCGEYQAGWFLWALRDAVASKGYYKDALSADIYYERLNNEIASACAKGLIKCSTTVIPFLPSITKSQYLLVPGAVIEAINLISLKNPLPLYGGNSHDVFPDLENVRKLLNYPLVMPSISEEKGSYRIINGWFYSGKNEFIRLHCSGNGGGSQYSIQISRLPSPDVKNNFKNAYSDNQRFSIKLYYSDNCNFSYKENLVNASDVSSNNSYSLDKDGILHIDSVKENSTFKRMNFLKIKEYLLALYELIIPVVILLGFLSFLLTTLFFLRKRSCLVLYLVSLAFWVLLVSRLALLIVVFISSFPALIPLYVSAAYPLVVVASMLSIAILIVNFNNYYSIKFLLNKINFLKNTIKK
jgi:hypothetical protein